MKVQIQPKPSHTPLSGTDNLFGEFTTYINIFSERLPFELEVFFNSQDQASTNNRGFCLNYYQIPC